MKALYALLMLALALAAGAASAATITIVNTDSPNEGFNDPTPVNPVGGNPGTTIGQQRLNLFQRAADIWGGLLESEVEVRVESSFDALPCDAGSAVLGSAGPLVINRDHEGADFPGTWYHGALSDKQAGTDLDPGFNDIRARFNSNIDNNANCLTGRNWYYGFDGNSNDNIALLPVLLHEMAHGLGFSTFVDGSNGQELLGFPDIYERFILDNTTGQRWDEMSNSQRANSALNDGNLVWDGPAVTAASNAFLNGSPVLEFRAPSNPAGILSLGSASFGPDLDSFGVTGELVLADDGNGNVNDACGPLVNGAQIAGNIALIDRGSCSFADKALAAEAAGAIAVIIVDNLSSNTPPGLGGSAPGLLIPTVSVTLSDGNLLKSELANGVNVTLRLDPSRLAGADNQNRVKLFAPNPIQGGSSISHFDVSANPSLLMEPSITPDLNDGVDLTLQHFQDIGWTSPQVTAVGTVPAARNNLGPAYPNPFNPSTSIDFRVAQSGQVRLSIHDAAGRLVRILVQTNMTAGEYTVRWSGVDSAGRRAPSGLYFYRLVAGGYEETRKMVMLK
jgi:hypothetical protein